MAAEGDNNQARILATGSIADGIQDAYIIIEKKVLLRATKLTEIVPLLFCMFFVFNLSYVPGANSFYLFLEHVFLQTRAATKKHTITKLILRLGL